METRLSLAPGQNGTKKLLARFGERLVRVRYRYDARRKLRIKTVELIVETVPWVPRQKSPPWKPDEKAGVRIAFGETDLRRQVKAAGGVWRADRKLWEIDWGTVLALGLRERVAEEGEGRSK
jgi:hypothetical protein